MLYHNSFLGEGAQEAPQTQQSSQQHTDRIQMAVHGWESVGKHIQGQSFPGTFHSSGICPSALSEASAEPPKGQAASSHSSYHDARVAGLLAAKALFFPSSPMPCGHLQPKPKAPGPLCDMVVQFLHFHDEMEWDERKLSCGSGLGGPSRQSSCDQLCSQLAKHGQPCTTGKVISYTPCGAGLVAAAVLQAMDFFVQFLRCAVFDLPGLRWRG